MSELFVVASGRFWVFFRLAYQTRAGFVRSARAGRFKSSRAVSTPQPSWFPFIFTPLAWFDPRVHSERFEQPVRSILENGFEGQWHSLVEIPAFSVKTSNCRIVIEQNRLDASSTPPLSYPVKIGITSKTKTPSRTAFSQIKKQRA
jgi:hypothetical protein